MLNIQKSQNVIKVFSFQINILHIVRYLSTLKSINLKLCLEILGYCKMKWMLFIKLEILSKFLFCHNYLYS